MVLRTRCQLRLARIYLPITVYEILRTEYLPQAVTSTWRQFDHLME